MSQKQDSTEDYFCASEVISSIYDTKNIRAKQAKHALPFFCILQEVKQINFTTHT